MATVGAKTSRPQQARAADSPDLTNTGGQPRTAFRVGLMSPLWEARYRYGFSSRWRPPPTRSVTSLPPSSSPAQPHLLRRVSVSHGPDAWCGIVLEHARVRPCSGLRLVTAALLEDEVSGSGAAHSVLPGPVRPWHPSGMLFGNPWPPRTREVGVGVHSPTERWHRPIAVEERAKVVSEVLVTLALADGRTRSMHHLGLGL